jgi:hypothetical protein
MRPPGVAANDPLLRLQQNEEHLRELKRWEVLRLRFWARVADLAEREWLRANGWVHRGEGWWSLPKWHPKRRGFRDRYDVRGYNGRPRQRGTYESRELVYDQSHAANSQRYYIRTVQTPRTGERMLATARFKQLEHRQMMAMAGAHFFAGVGGVIFGKFGLSWVSVLFFLAAAVALCISLAAWRASIRELEMNFIEEQLKGRADEGVQRSDQVGSGR